MIINNTMLLPLEVEVWIDKCLNDEFLNWRWMQMVNNCLWHLICGLLKRISMSILLRWKLCWDFVLQSWDLRANQVLHKHKFHFDSFSYLTIKALPIQQKNCSIYRGNCSFFKNEQRFFLSHTQTIFKVSVTSCNEAIRTTFSLSPIKLNDNICL